MAPLPFLHATPNEIRTLREIFTLTRVHIANNEGMTIMILYTVGERDIKLYRKKPGMMKRWQSSRASGILGNVPSEKIRAYGFRMKSKATRELLASHQTEYRTLALVLFSHAFIESHAVIHRRRRFHSARPRGSAFDGMF